jgi:hypothetical protein
LILVLGLACFGCQGGGNNRQAERNQMPVNPTPTARRVSDPPAIPPLHIPSTPPSAEATKPQPNAPVVEKKPDVAEVKTTHPLDPVEQPRPTPVTPPMPSADVVAAAPTVQPEVKPSVPEAAIPAGDPMAHLKRLQKLAEESAAKLDQVTARMTRREQVNGKDGPEEVVECKFRKEPFSVYFKWIGQSFKGREVIFVQGQHDSKIHTWMSPSESYFGMKRAPALAPDSPLIRSRSRHTITSAGIWQPVAQFARLVVAQAQGDTRLGKMTYLGNQKHVEYEKLMETVEQVIPPGGEAALPGGGKRTWAFDADTHLPLLIATRDDKGQVVEYYCYTEVQHAPALSDNDFHPEKQWAKR